MNEPVASETYAAQIRRLAELTSRVAAQREEAHTWYAQQCAAADRAVAEATAQVRRAEAEAAEARELVERVDAEAAHLWQELRTRLGASARRLGDPPGPARDASGDPVPLLHGVRELLDRTRQPGELPGSLNPLLVLCGVGGAVVAYVLGVGARAVGTGSGGDLAVGMPVLGLVVTLLGPLVGLAPARLLADRRHAVLGPRPITVVLTAGLVTTVLLLALAPR
ncbi:MULTISPECIES: hypothetical protein [Micromonospora]|uniref:Uncharacterized protein n=1 Tax=Micromonospora sicca TaxID=2202420 RepID=A0ABU5JH40_9ACTN|nr:MULTISPECIES: hypothetical protein [unclassified Micromonospora]MBM0229753.1 hypothetical protein [Micromonospora sp. ATA51]MDZ5446169.1 hypothetical protein [Micromonospora sp. 4G57]MDZ5491947.1 hypothetical protein [Micromonospora sp. 4G53]